MNNEIKQGIRRKFNRAASTYDDSCAVQQMICQYAIDLLLGCQKTFTHIADFGCGTGESTIQLMQHVAFDWCYALDFSEQLLLIAQNKLSQHAHLTWIHSDFEQLVTFPEPIDLIFSNMALQWSDDWIKTLCLWRTYLRPKGLLLFSIPIHGNFPELKADYKKSCLSQHDILGMLSRNDWELVAQENKMIQATFENQREALRSLKATGTNGQSVLNRHHAGLLPIKPEDFFIDPYLSQLTYNIGIYLIRKSA